MNFQTVPEMLWVPKQKKEVSGESWKHTSKFQQTILGNI